MPRREIRLISAGKDRYPLGYMPAPTLLEASVKRSMRGPTLLKIEDDYTMKEVNSMLSRLLGSPGKSAGNAQNTLNSSIADMRSGYTAGQMDNTSNSSSSGFSLASLADPAAAIGLGILDFGLGQLSADIAWNRQKQFTELYQTPAAQVRMYQDAGLNPMGLTGSASGPTSAPSVQPASLGGATDILNALLGYKARMAEVAVRRDDVSSKIEWRAEQKLYQQKVNEWFDLNQITSINKSIADTELTLKRIETEDSQKRLNEAGISKATADAALSFQLALQKEFENSPEYRANTLALQRARANEANAVASEMYEAIKNLASQRNEITSRIALNYANTNLGRQQLKNLGLTEQQIEFAVKHQKGDLIFSRINQVTSSLKDIGIAAGGFASAATGLSSLAPAAKIIGFGAM